ncbi:MAG: PEP-CTERM sorting domain-containing protein [Oryzomonas sp.]|uniref:PEP-CTERM sorting domain-containing protein n=1 Tax=Oryzomonas sp. TaxID=2855186 RepID=UPI00284D9A51|nr:PEP-CTERM sorting domain-containing protein [Oryzomonas sp.]MDR3580664.1 PEP-CTERM sorting domain-containing protein [Oryzomonas sp.]
MNKIFLMMASLLLLMASSSYATPIVGNYYIGGTYNQIYSVTSVGDPVGGGSIAGSTLNGASVPFDYCVDLFTDVYASTDYGKSIITNDGTIHYGQTNAGTINNVGQVAWLLDQYAIRAETNTDLQIALQAAIWAAINGTSKYSLDASYYAGHNGQDIVNDYNTMLGDLNGTTIGNISNYDWITPVDSNGNQYQAQVTLDPVPEPGTIMLLGAGMLGFAFYGRRRKNSMV